MLALVVASLVFIIFAIKWIKQIRESPPGPWGLPIVGYYPFFGKNPFVDLKQLAEKYGDIMKINIMNEDLYFLNSPELITEALVNKADNFWEKPTTFNMLSHLLTEKSIVHGHGEYWQTIYRFFIGKLSDLGMGKTEFESRIHDACEAVVKNIENEKGKPFDAYQYLIHFTTNVISLLVYSKNYDYKDSEFIQLKETTFNCVRVLDYWDGILVGPLFHLIKRIESKGYRATIEVRSQFHHFMAQILKQRFDQKEKDDFIDVLHYFFDEMKGRYSKYFNHETLLLTFINLFIAGTETSAMTFYFALNFVARYPHVQQKVHEEIDQELGRDRLASFADRRFLNYTNAVVTETLRYTAIVPYISRCNQTEDVLGGYKIPKGSNVVMNFWKASRDKRHFKNPDSFDPNNFLDENGQFVSNDAYMPFSIGKRKCLGAKLAETELFLLFVTVMQKFEFKLPDDVAPELIVLEGQIRACSPFKICAIPR